jgi:hypothetical protein
MPSRRQIKAAKKRAENQAKAEREYEEIQANAQRLRTMVGGFSNSNRQGSKSKLLSPVPYRRETPPIPSATIKDTIIHPERKEMSPEMKMREELAQAEIQKKKSRVAVLYNKGGLQYISDEMDPKTFGRK